MIVWLTVSHQTFSVGIRFGINRWLMQHFSTKRLFLGCYCPSPHGLCVNSWFFFFVGGGIWIYFEKKRTSVWAGLMHAGKNSLYDPKIPSHKGLNIWAARKCLKNYCTMIWVLHHLKKKEQSSVFCRTETLIYATEIKYFDLFCYIFGRLEVKFAFPSTDWTGSVVSEWGGGESFGWC